MEPSHTVAPPRTTIDALARQPLLSGATSTSLAALADAANAIELAAGDAAVHSGQSDDNWFVVLNGELMVQLEDRPPRRLLAGDSFGEIAVLHKCPRTATVVATTAVRLAQIPGQELRRMLAAAPD